MTSAATARRRAIRLGATTAGGSLVALLVLVALLAPWIAPYPPEEQLDSAVAMSRPPFSSMMVVELADGTVMLADEIRRRGSTLVIVARGIGACPDTPLLSPHLGEAAADHAAPDQAGAGAVDAFERDRSRGALRSCAVSSEDVTRIAPRRYLLGTDRLGRDVLSRLVWGARTSLGVGVASAVLALLLGVLVGAAAALGGPVWDEVLMRTVDGLLAFPALLLVLALALFFEPGTAVLVAIIGGTAWMGLSRLVRAELLSLRARPFVLAARSLGASEPRLLFTHLLPNAWPTIAIAGCLLVGDAILVESAVSFLGLAGAGDLPSWGRMVAHERADPVGLWWMSTLPGLGIVATVLGFNLLGEGLRDAFDPRLRRRGNGRPA